MDKYQLKAFNNNFINELLKYENETKIFKNIGTIISQKEIKFLINSSKENHSIINKIATFTLRVY